MNLDKLAEDYLRLQYVDYGDLNEQAEEQIKEAFKAGYMHEANKGIQLAGELSRTLNKP